MEDWQTPPDLVAKEDQGKAGFEALGRMYGGFIKSLKSECGCSERAAADVLIAYIEAHPSKRKEER
jgi:hypothetical protein